MSYTLVRGVWPGEKLEDIATLSNAWQSAPVAWDALGKKYLGWQGGAEMFSDSKRLWALADDGDIPPHHRALLMMTFDAAYILRKDYTRANVDLLACGDLIDIGEEATNHWVPIRALFGQMPDIPAIGFVMTSVSDDPWYGPPDPETDEVPIAWAKTYDLYAALDGVK